MVGTAAGETHVRIVIVGAGGRLGAALAREWGRGADEIIGLNHAALDLADSAAIKRALQPLSFDALVNCAAVTNVDYCESRDIEAFRINCTAVAEMGALCGRKRARMIHISTDYVFDGEKREPYTEGDRPRPLGVYAASKLAGERALQAALPEALSVRVSWVFGPDRPSFVDQILTRARETDDLSAIGDKWASPSYTLDIANRLRPFLFDLRNEAGLLHLCNTGACTWQEYGQFALDCAAEFGAPLRGRNVAPLKMAELKAFVAKRPVHTSMSTEKLTRLTGEPPRSWQDAVREYIQQSLATGG